MTSGHVTLCIAAATLAAGSREESDCDVIDHLPHHPQGLDYFPSLFTSPHFPFSLIVLVLEARKSSCRRPKFMHYNNLKVIKNKDGVSRSRLNSHRYCYHTLGGAL